MRDAQSTLDQLITFCGTDITKDDVLDVYGIVDPNTISAIAENHPKKATIKIYWSTLEKIAEDGRDLYRLLCDLRDHFRSRMVDSVRAGGNERTDAIGRILTVLHNGEAGVQGGLSQLVNLESTY